MSGVIELFWKPQPKDVPSGMIAQGRYFERNDLVAAAAATITVNSVVCPPNTARVITGVAMSATPGAAQTVSVLGVSWQFGSGLTFFRLAANAPVGYPAATRLDQFLNLGDGIWLRPGEALFYAVTFNAGVAVNAGNVHYYGYEFPIGNTL